MPTLVTEIQVYEALNKVMDPEMPHSLVELGLIQEVDIVDGEVRVDMQLTTPHCPFAEQIVRSVKEAVMAIDGVEAVQVERACAREE